MFSAIKACRRAASPEVLPARADTQANQVTQPMHQLVGKVLAKYDMWTYLASM
jgi:hypothetical protein